ncbi:hypothetical protein NMG60_11023425 [Bertholletia excelsa]
MDTVLMVEKLRHSFKPTSKVANLLPSEALSASLLAFRSDVGKYLDLLLTNSKPGSEFLSLPWIHRCLELLSDLNRAFAKLVVDIDHPMNKWDAPSIEEYLNYSLKLLELINSISSSISYLRKVRLSLAHALTLLESSSSSAIERVKAANFKNHYKELTMEEKEEKGQKLYNGKEKVIHEALMVMKINGYRVCGIVLSGLSGNIKPYMVMKKAAEEFPSSSSHFNLLEETMDQKWVLKEVKNVNNAANYLVTAVAAGEGDLARKELERKLEEMHKLLDVIGKETDWVFSEILAGRTKLLDGLRFNQKP